MTPNAQLAMMATRTTTRGAARPDGPIIGFGIYSPIETLGGGGIKVIFKEARGAPWCQDESEGEWGAGLLVGKLKSRAVSARSGGGQHSRNSLSLIDKMSFRNTAGSASEKTERKQRRAVVVVFVCYLCYCRYHISSSSC